MNSRERKFDLAGMLTGMVRMWSKNPLRTLWKIRFLIAGFMRSALARGRLARKQGLLVPMGLGLSPTMRCNLSCRGCYSRFHSKKEEMPIEAVDRTVREAREAGVFLFVVTGGEPYIRPEMMEIYSRYRDVVFLTVTNGTLIDEYAAARIARAGNIVPMVSIEGDEEQTESRRGAGVYGKVLVCMDRLRAEGVLFGFSAVVTRLSSEVLSSDAFVSHMVGRGCSIGFYNDLIPVDPEDLEHLPSRDQRSDFRRRLPSLRRRYPILLVHLPDDEYDGTGRCSAVGGGALHINAQGFAEPCPFAHFALENLKFCSFHDVLRSPFLRAVREHPTALQHGEIGCALVNNCDILRQIAEQTGARPTRPPAGERTGGKTAAIPVE
jgi:MoaA/NifB/PqqE/SkfB family radical SAM enzyme